jgi:hypothetical protein
MSAPVVQNTHEFMHVLRNVPIHSVETGTMESTVDLHQLFYEFIAYCSEDVAACIPYVGKSYVWICYYILLYSVYHRY